MDADGAEPYEHIEISPPEEFFFFPRFYITAFFMALFSIGLIVVIWAPIIYFYFFENLRYVPAIRASTYLTATFLLLVIFGRITKKEMSKVRFTVSREGIARSDSYRKTAVRWNEISAVRCRKFPLIKGFAEVVTDRGKLIFPSTITGFGQLCLSLQKGVEHAGKADLLDDAKVRMLGAFGLASERWNERARKALGPFIIATMAMTFFNLLVASRLWELEVIPAMIWAGMGLPVPLVSYSIADLLINNRLEKALISGKDTGSGGSGVQRCTALVVGLGYGVFGIFFKALFPS